MKIFKEISIILSISVVSQILVTTFKFPISASVTGIIILFILLMTKIIKEDDIKDTSDFLSHNLIFFYIPSAVAIIEEYHYIKKDTIPFITICMFCRIIIMVSTSMTAQICTKIKEREI